MLRSKRLLFTALVAYLGFLGICSPSFAQIGTGTISGTVTDSSGAVLTGASITVKNRQTGVATPVAVNDQGRYIAPDLVVGSYDVQAQMGGFRTQLHTGVTVTVGTNVVVDFSLPVGEASETVRVEGASTQVDTTSSEISALIGQTQVANLPLNGRNFEELILLAPGVQAVTSGTQGSFYGREPSYSIAGSRPSGQALLLDGANIQGFWNHGAGNSIIGTSLGVEAIGEFQVLTNSYSARFGGSGSVMNATTRSGTNDFHGGLYDYFRNNVLDARNFFNTTASPQNAYRHNQFGGNLGGPIKKDKAFFFVNYEGLRRLIGQTILPTVPDTGTRLGNLPDCVVNPGPTCNPAARDAVPLNSASGAIMALYPTGGANPTQILLPGSVCGSTTNCGPSGINQIVLNGTQPANEDYVNLRLDYHLSPNDSIFARYVFDNGSLSDPFVSGNPAGGTGLYPEQSKGRNQYLTLGYKKLFSASLLSDARFSFVRTNMRAFVTASNPVLQFFAPLGETRQDGDISVPGVSGIGPSPFTPDFEIQNTYSLADDVFWTRGNHTFEFGAEFRRLQSPLANGFFDDQGWVFPNLLSFVEGMPVSPTDPPITLIGALPGKNNSRRSFRENNFFPYFQDTWKVSRTVTLNLGLRYDFISNPVEIHNQLCAFIDPSNPATTGCTPVPNVFRSNPSLKSLDPRVGIAWDPFKDHKTSIRAGAGVFHDPIQVRNYHPAYIFAGPYQTAVSLCVFGPPCSFPTPFPPGLTVPIPTIGEALEYDPRVSPFVWQYNFGVQREVAHETVLSVAYVGSRGYNLMVQNDLNPPIPTTINGRPNFLGAPRNNPNLGSIAFNQPDGLSWYNSLQIYLTRNLSKNWQFQASYTYSKCIDYSSHSFGLETGGDPAQGRSNPYNLAADKGACDFDIRHNFVANAVYAFPFKGRAFVEGWQLSTVITARSGGPFTVIDGFDQAGLNNPAAIGGAERPNLASGGKPNPILGTVNQWYDANAFALQGPGFLGDLGRNTLVGPKFADVDLSLSKNTRIHENIGVEFRAEVFNLFNHPNFALPNATLFTGVDASGNGIPNPTAGQITSTVGTSRQMQLALKFRF